MEESRFVEKVCKYFFCTICTNVMDKASSLPCGHEFCEQCLIDSLKINPCCPLCRSKNTDFVPSFEKRSRIMSSEVKCVYKECPFTTTLSRIKAHEQNCKYNPANVVENKINLRSSSSSSSNAVPFTSSLLRRTASSSPSSYASLPRSAPMEWIVGREGCPRYSCARCWDRDMSQISTNGRCGLCQDCYEATEPWD